ncbi:bifunctional metallophosphatase/5'-nucleotidase [Nocardioides humi]|uniref:5'-nucleotidase n=1 Tax=Nocardioides humi TaxID=449461 RepID=A0ABN2B3C2_9ACTN|nr:5'-nucleotidase C-terminal domain-containing protein [Nocardioides humi]
MRSLKQILAGSLGATLALSGLASLSPAPVQAAGPEVEVQILGTNDFHGRLLQNAGSREAGAAVLAGAVNQFRTENPNTVFAAAGDLIGASTFESFIQRDKPTIDALNAAGLDVSAVGNHELDQGYDDLINRVTAPYDPTTNPEGGAEWQYIAANLRMKDSDDPAVDATYIQTVGGKEIGFVGAVTEDLPSLVSPAGIADIRVDDIVDSVNAAAAELKDEDGVDLVVMLVHEGSASVDCDSPQFTDPTTTWGNIVQNTSAAVDAIISGHTHLAYDCSFPVAEWADRPVTERPVVSAGQYGMNLNRLVFTIDDDGVTGVDTALVPLMTEDPDGPSGPLLPEPLYPADPAVTDIVQDAEDQAEVLGAEELGQIAAPLNRAKLENGTTENRGGESTLGNLVAEVQRWATERSESGSAQIAFMNPGGLRQDMVGTVVDQDYLDEHPDSTAQIGDRILTYKQAAVVQPFANTLVNMRLTGAQIKKVLEQQWQRAANGTVPSRPFLRLGVSKGFTYTYSEKPVTVEGTPTFAGEVTGMWLNGVPISPTATYSVTVNSFLASGGDNFFELANGASKADTGKVDLQAMVDYLAEKAATDPLPVDYSQRAVGVSFPAGAPSAYAPGATVAFDVSSWTMATADDTKDTEVQVRLGATVLGSFPLDNTIGTDVYDQYGKAGVSVTLPAGTPGGAQALTLVGAQTGTQVQVPITVASAVTMKIKIKPKRVVAGKTRAKVVVQVRDAAGAPVNGTVKIKVKGQKAKTVTVVDGKAKLKAKKFAKAGKKKVTVTYQGSDTTLPAKAKKKIKVVRR